LRLKGEINKACVQSVLIYGSEIRAMKVNDMRTLVKGGEHFVEIDVWCDIEG